MVCTPSPSKVRVLICTSPSSQSKTWTPPPPLPSEYSLGHSAGLVVQKHDMAGPVGSDAHSDAIAHRVPDTQGGVQGEHDGAVVKGAHAAAFIAELVVERDAGGPGASLGVDRVLRDDHAGHTLIVHDDEPAGSDLIGHGLGLILECGPCAHRSGAGEHDKRNKQELPCAAGCARGRGCEWID